MVIVERIGVNAGYGVFRGADLIKWGFETAADARYWCLRYGAMKASEVMRTWEPNEIDFLRRSWGKEKVAYIAAMLDRTDNEVVHQARRMKLLAR